MGATKILAQQRYRLDGTRKQGGAEAGWSHQQHSGLLGITRARCSRSRVKQKQGGATSNIPSCPVPQKLNAAEALCSRSRVGRSAIFQSARCNTGSVLHRIEVLWVRCSKSSNKTISEIWECNSLRQR